MVLAHENTAILGAVGSAFSATGVSDVRIVGSTVAVHATVEFSLRARVATVTRLAGADRFATAVAVNQHAFPGATSMFIATGANFPDALSAAAVAGARNAPMYLAYPHCVPASVLAESGRLGARTAVLIGSTSALDENVAVMRSC